MNRPDSVEEFATELLAYDAVRVAWEDRRILYSPGWREWHRRHPNVGVVVIVLGIQKFHMPIAWCKKGRVGFWVLEAP